MTLSRRSREEDDTGTDFKREDHSYRRTALHKAAQPPPSLKPLFRGAWPDRSCLNPLSNGVKSRLSYQESRRPIGIMLNYSRGTNLLGQAIGIRETDLFYGVA
jgi:hypothetical protein